MYQMNASGVSNGQNVKWKLQHLVSNIKWTCVVKWKVNSCFPRELQLLVMQQTIAVYR